jgi:hypothetical protein
VTVRVAILFYFSVSFLQYVEGPKKFKAEARWTASSSLSLMCCTKGHGQSAQYPVGDATRSSPGL